MGKNEGFVLGTCTCKNTKSNRDDASQPKHQKSMKESSTKTKVNPFEQLMAKKHQAAAAARDATFTAGGAKRKRCASKKGVVDKIECEGIPTKEQILQKKAETNAKRAKDKARKIAKWQNNLLLGYCRNTKKGNKCVAKDGPVTVKAEDGSMKEGRDLNGLCTLCKSGWAPGVRNFKEYVCEKGCEYAVEQDGGYCESHVKNQKINKTLSVEGIRSVKRLMEDRVRFGMYARNHEGKMEATPCEIIPFRLTALSGPEDVVIRTVSEDGAISEGFTVSVKSLTPLIKDVNTNIAKRISRIRKALDLEIQAEKDRQAAEKKKKFKGNRGFYRTFGADGKPKDHNTDE